MINTIQIKIGGFMNEFEMTRQQAINIENYIYNKLDIINYFVDLSEHDEINLQIDVDTSTSGGNIINKRVFNEFKAEEFEEDVNELIQKAFNIFYN